MFCCEVHGSFIFENLFEVAMLEFLDNEDSNCILQGCLIWRCDYGLKQGGREYWVAELAEKVDLSENTFTLTDVLEIVLDKLDSDLVSSNSMLGLEDLAKGALAEDLN